MKIRITLITGFVLVFIFALFNPSFEKEPKFELSGAGLAIDSWYQQRAYPNETINQQAYSKAFEVHQIYTSKQSRGISNGWKAIGPANFGGRTLSLAINPENTNTIYAGSASGGLWRSYTGGEGVNAWHYVSTGFPVLGVMTIAITPNDSNTIYIGTGEVYNYQNVGTGHSIRHTRGTYGIGILKSIDGGKNWNKSLDWSYSDLKGINDIVVDSVNTNIVWAATSEGTYKSLDAGANWQKAHNISMATDILIHPNDHNILFVSCGNFASQGHGIYRSKDGGTNFTKLANGLPNTYDGKVMLTINPSSPYQLYASVANYSASIGLYQSNDVGDTWTLLNAQDIAKYQGWFAHDIAVNPNNPNEMIFVGVEGWKSSDAGANFQKKSSWNSWDFSATPVGGPEGPPNYMHADIHRILFHPSNSNIIYFATDGGIFKSKDGGETFEGANGMYQTVQFYADFSNSATDSNLAIGGLQDNATTIYEGNLAWKRTIGGDGGSTAIDPTDDQVIYGTSQYLNLKRSFNRGLNWTNIRPPQEGTENFVPPYALCNNNSTILYAGRSKIYVSTDQGSSYSATNNDQDLDGTPINEIMISPLNCDVVFASNSPLNNVPSTLYRTTNGGTTWMDITGNLPDRYLMEIAFHPNNDNIVYAVASGFGSSHVFRSADQGNTWNDIDNGNLPDVPTNSIVVDPFFPKHIYIGNDLGVYYSADEGSSWTVFSDSLPDAIIAMDLSISLANKKLRVATHGNGAWEAPLVDGGIVTGIIASDLNEQIKVYPTLFNDFIRIESDFAVTATLFDINGKEIQQTKGQYFTMKNLNVPAGSYYLSLVSEKGRVVRKLVKYKR